MSQATQTGREAKPSFGRSVLTFLREVLTVVIGALVLSALLRAFVAQPFLIPSGSMENTLQVEDRVVVQKLTGFDRGDIVVFEDPGGWLSNIPAEPRDGLGQVMEFFGFLPDNSDNHLIKRVIGTPGDTVACCDPQGRLQVNGVALDESEYLYSAGGQTVEAARVPFEVVVPAEKVFVMGDHRDVSADSRCHLSDTEPGDAPGANAFVPEDKVVGVAWVVIAPFEHWRSFGTPPTFDRVPPPASLPPAQARISPEGVSC